MQISYFFFGNVRKKTCLVSVWGAKRPNMSFQCSQEERLDFCSGYKGTRHVVFNARKKADLIFVLDTRNHSPGMMFSMLARKRTIFFCFGCKKSRHLVFDARKKTKLIFVFGTRNPGMCHSHSPHHQDSVEQQSAVQESLDLQPPTAHLQECQRCHHHLV